MTSTGKMQSAMPVSTSVFSGTCQQKTNSAVSHAHAVVHVVDSKTTAVTDSISTSASSTGEVSTVLGVELVDASQIVASTSCSPGRYSVGDASADVPPSLFTVGGASTDVAQLISPIGEYAATGITFDKKPKRKRVRKKRIFERTNVCGYCFATFSTSTMMERHILVHTGEKPFPCEVCGAAFRQRAHLTEHMRRHTGEKPFRCVVCDASFTRSNSLKQHLASHAGTRKFQCEHCPAMFMRQFDLKRHTKVHFFDGPHKCTLCTASFNKSSNLKKHTVIHCGEETYVRKRQKELVVGSDLEETVENGRDGVIIGKDVACDVRSVLNSFTDASEHHYAESDSESDNIPQTMRKFALSPNMTADMNVRTDREVGESCWPSSTQYIKQEPLSPSNQGASDESHTSACFGIKTEPIDTDMYEKIGTDRPEAAFHAASGLLVPIFSGVKPGRFKPESKRFDVNGENAATAGQSEVNTENDTEASGLPNLDIPKVKTERISDVEEDDLPNPVANDKTAYDIVRPLPSENLNHAHIPEDHLCDVQNVHSESHSVGRGLNLRIKLKETPVDQACLESSKVANNISVKEEPVDDFSEMSSVNSDDHGASVSYKTETETDLGHQGPVPVFMFRSNDISENDFSYLEGQEGISPKATQRVASEKMSDSSLNNDGELPMSFESETRDQLGASSSEKPYTCTQCPAAFTQVCHLRDHIRTHTGEKPFVCTLCSAAFARSSALKRHMYTHTDQKPFVCTICNAAFKQLCHLKQHKKTHSDNKIQCEYCDASFARPSELKAHVRKHTGERPFVCSVCNASFSRRESWRNHEKNHSGDKPYKCEYCEASFVWKKCLISHRELHFGKRPFACDRCTASFKKQRELNRHVKVHETIRNSDS